MQLFLVEKCLKCRSERFQTQVATDSMIAKSGDQDWGVVYEYREDDLDDGACPPPRAVLLRQDGQWVRRSVRATLVDGEWMMEFIDEGD